MSNNKMSTVYSIDFIISLKNKSVPIPDETISLIQSLSNTVGSNTYSRTPVFNKKIMDKRKPQYKDTSNWEAVRNFKKTEIVSNEGVDKIVDQLRSLLNKLTSINYDKIKPQIIQIVKEIIDNNNVDDINKIGNFIFDVASTNKFYSEIYAVLYSEMLQLYSILKDILDKNLDSYLILFNNIESCDPKKDYDKFCKINLENDKRRAISMFLINLMKNNVIEEKIIINIINKLQNTLNSYTEIKDNSEIQEIIDNISIIITNGYNNFSNKSILNNCIQENYDNVINKPGLSNKAKFKYMDIIDFIKKN